MSKTHSTSSIILGQVHLLALFLNGTVNFDGDKKPNTFVLHKVRPFRRLLNLTDLLRTLIAQKESGFFYSNLKNVTHDAFVLGARDRTLQARRSYRDNEGRCEGGAAIDATRRRGKDFTHIDTRSPIRSIRRTFSP